MTPGLIPRKEEDSVEIDLNILCNAMDLLEQEGNTTVAHIGREAIERLRTTQIIENRLAEGLADVKAGRVSEELK